MAYKTIMNKEELEERLRELSKTDTVSDFGSGAMCYFPASPSPVDYICPECGKITTQSDFLIHDIITIREHVSEMHDMGYDVFLNEKEFCIHCGDNAKEFVSLSDYEWGYKESFDSFLNRKKYDPELVFGIKFENESEYHVVRSNLSFAYKDVLGFLKGNDGSLDINDDMETFRYHVEILQKMLGIGLDILISKDISDPEE